MSADSTVSNTGEFLIVRERLITVEAKVDLVLARLDASVVDHESRLRNLEKPNPTDVDHEQRIRALESQTSSWRGTFAVLTVGLSALLSVGAALLVQVLGR